MKPAMLFVAAVALALMTHVTFSAECPPIGLQAATSATPRTITISDQLSVRRVDVLKLSPDRRRYAMLVRQADAANNRYCRSWFVGEVAGGAPVFVGDGGEATLALGMNNRYVGGEFDKPALRWSPDGKWLAYRRTHDGQVQVWISRADGSAREQLTRSAADVDQLEWSADGKSIFFTVGTPRAELQARAEARDRRGYHYDSELVSFTDFMLPRHDGVEPDTTRTVWMVSLSSRQERVADAKERGDFERAQARSGSTDARLPVEADKIQAFAVRDDGAQAWAAQPHERSFLSRMSAVMRKGSRPIACQAAQCTGFISGVWWRKDGAVMFLRGEYVEEVAWELYAWSPKSGAVSLVMRLQDVMLTDCQLAASDSLLCVHETQSQPIQVAGIDLTSGAVSTVGEVNPEFRHIRLGVVERIDFDTPTFAWSAPGAPLEHAYARRGFGYILYPPDFDPARKYPVFMSPYAASGFDNITNVEFALHALAARGFIVLSSSFPQPETAFELQHGPETVARLYSHELGFPHMTMLAESTLKFLDVVAARGFIDTTRVGIGGVSQGAAVPLFTMIKHDRFAALTLSTGGWDPMEYYVFSPNGRRRIGSVYDWLPNPAGAGEKFWKELSIAENAAAVEAPILFNLIAAELYGTIRLTRHLDELGKPYDVYAYPNETHIKFQPAHLEAIIRRNVDWLRFWLQSYEDPAPEKATQYERWRKLRELQEASRSRSSESAVTRTLPPGSR